MLWWKLVEDWTKVVELTGLVTNGDEERNVTRLTQVSGMSDRVMETHLSLWESPIWGREVEKFSLGDKLSVRCCGGDVELQRVIQVRDIYLRVVYMWEAFKGHRNEQDPLENFQLPSLPLSFLFPQILQPVFFPILFWSVSFSQVVSKLQPQWTSCEIPDACSLLFLYLWPACLFSPRLESPFCPTSV